MDLNQWLTDGRSPIDETHRAIFAARRIADKPTQITFRRDDGTSVPSQTFRVEWNNQSTFESGATVLRGVHQATLFGVRNHPTIADSNVQKGDRFNFHGATFEVKTVVYTLGEVQAFCEATT